MDFDKAQSVGQYQSASNYQASTNNKNQPEIRPNGSSWLIYTIVGASILILLIALVILYDLWSRYRELREQHIFDGGQPATPSHSCSYLFNIKTDEASQNFDFKRSVIRLELLDNQNQYMTSIAVPCFLFKLKVPGQKSNESMTRAMNAYPSPPDQGPKSSYLHQAWSGMAKSNYVTFILVRRHPLIKLASIRISHDCYTPGSYISFKYISVREETSHQCVKCDLTGHQIKALHPCPPSAFNVFPFELMENSRALDDKRTFCRVIGTSIKRGCCTR